MATFAAYGVHISISPSDDGKRLCVDINTTGCGVRYHDVDGIPQMTVLLNDAEIYNGNGPNERRRRQRVIDLAAEIRQALADDPEATAEDIREIVLDARADYEKESNE